MPTQNEESMQSSQNIRPNPYGQILQIKHSRDGFSQLTIDNGIPHRLHILARAEDFPALASSDLAAIRAHLMTRQPGHFRSKRGR